MTRKASSRWWSAVAVAMLSLCWLVAGCSSPHATSCATDAVPGVTIAVGGRANSPQPASTLPKDVDAAMDRAIDSGLGVSVIRVDGRPDIFCSFRYSSNSVNDAAKNRDRAYFHQLVAAAVAAVRAERPEADVLTALSLAAKTAGPGGTVVLIDSGLQTVRPLDMAHDHILGANADQVATQLGKAGALPDLHDRSVILMGLGYTAAPQDALNDFYQNWLIGLWTAIVAKASNNVPPNVVGVPNTNGAPPDQPKVALVTVPKDAIDFCNTDQVMADAGPVGFVADQDVFNDPEAAKRALSLIAAFLTEHRGAHAAVTGTIAHYGADQADAGLALSRAKAVVRVLRDLGVSADQLVPHGGGWGPFPTKTAGPDLKFDQSNRRVVIGVTCA